MSFDKNYPNRKDRRKQYHDSRAVDTSCRNNKSCPYCKGNRKYFDTKKRKAADEQLEAFDQILELFDGFFNKE